MVAVGVITKLVPTKPVFQVYVLAPLADSVLVFPAHTIVGLAVMVIFTGLLIFTLKVRVSLHPKEFPVTV